MTWSEEAFKRISVHRKGLKRGGATCRAPAGTQAITLRPDTKGEDERSPTQTAAQLHRTARPQGCRLTGPHRTSGVPATHVHGMHRGRGVMVGSPTHALCARPRCCPGEKVMAAVRAVAMAEAMATMRNHPTNPVCPFDPAPSEHMPARVDRRTSKLTNRAPRLTSTPAGMQRGRDDVVGSPTPPPPMRAGAAIACAQHQLIHV